MRVHQKTWLGIVRALVGFGLLGLAVSCSLSDDDDDGADDSGAKAGTAGQTGVNLGGRSGTAGSGADAGNESSAGTSGNGSGNACGDIATECGGSSVEANFKTVNILLVIDKSGSMVDEPEGFEDSKWDSMKEALDTALNRVAADVNFGLLLYPFSHVQQIPLDDCGDRCCEVPQGVQAINVPIGPGLESVPRILGALDDTAPGGGTPTADALAGALEYFTTGEGADLEGERYVLLATDGGPNCNADNSCDADRCTTNLDGHCDSGNCCESERTRYICLDDARVTENIEALAAEGIGTFVVGIPGTEAYATYLDGFARAGGFTDSDKPLTNPNAPPDYYAVSADGGVAGLVDVFETITTQLVRSCDIELASRPLDREKVRLYIDCEGIPRGEEEDPAWEVDTDADPSLLRLRGELCERVTNRGAERVDVVFGCPPIR